MKTTSKPTAPKKSKATTTTQPTTTATANATADKPTANKQTKAKAKAKAPTAKQTKTKTPTATAPAKKVLKKDYGFKLIEAQYSFCFRANTIKELEKLLRKAINELYI